MWGSNKHGCLGLGDTVNRLLPTPVCLRSQPPVHYASILMILPHRQGLSLLGA